MQRTDKQYQHQKSINDEEDQLLFTHAAAFEDLFNADDDRQLGEAGAEYDITGSYTLIPKIRID